jgi:hypothetical protein
MGVVDSAYYSANYAQVLSLVAQLEYRTLYQKSLKECDITRAFIQRCGWGGLNTIGFEVMCDFIMSDRLDNNTDNMSFYTFNPVDELSNLRHNILTALDNPSLWISKHQLSEHVLDLISKPTEIDNLVLFSAHFTIDGSDLLKKDGGRGTFWGFKQKRSKKYGESIESLLIRFFFEDFITKKVAPLEQKLSSELLTTFIAETVEADIYFLLGRDRTFLELSQAFNLDHSFIESEVSYLIQNNIIKPHDVLSITLNDNHVAGDEYITNFFFKKQLGRSELTPATLSRRLIRTKRILVLPAHINITVLTNSYDVVHS